MPWAMRNGSRPRFTCADINRSYMPGPYAERFPGLAPAQTSGATAANPFTILRAYGPSLGRDGAGPYRLLLIPCRDPADALTVVNLELSEDVSDAGISAILRSWERRFGARVVLFGPGYVIVSVDAPPRTDSVARRLAGEFFAFAPPEDALASSLHDMVPALMGRTSPGSDFPSSDYNRGIWAVRFSD
jgi:hypothetical protein